MGEEFERTDMSFKSARKHIKTRLKKISYRTLGLFFLFFFILTTINTLDISLKV